MSYEIVRGNSGTSTIDINVACAPLDANAYTNAGCLCDVACLCTVGCPAIDVGCPRGGGGGHVGRLCDTFVINGQPTNPGARAD